MQPAAGHLLLEMQPVLCHQLAKSLHQFGVELGPGILEQLAQCTLARHRSAVHMVGRHRVERVHNRDHPRAERQLIPAAIKPVLAAVVPGGGAVGDVQQIVGDAAAAEDLAANAAVTLHQQDFLAAQSPRLDEHVVGYAQLADVVQQRCDLQQLALFAAEVQRQGPGGHAQRDAQAVSCAGRVLHAQRGEQTGRHA